LLQVGRVDHAEANPENSLLPGEATLTEMNVYWTARGMTLDEGVALLGIHALMEVGFLSNSFTRAATGVQAQQLLSSC
jgi:hypothetical protein